MNAARRKVIAAAIDGLSAVRARLEEIRDEEQEAFDALPESFQDGEQGQAMQSAIEALEEAIETIENAESVASDAAA